MIDYLAWILGYWQETDEDDGLQDPLGLLLGGISPQTGQGSVTTEGEAPMVAGRRLVGSVAGGTRTDPPAPRWDAWSPLFPVADGVMPSVGRGTGSTAVVEVAPNGRGTGSTAVVEVAPTGRDGGFPVGLAVAPNGRGTGSTAVVEVAPTGRGGGFPVGPAVAPTGRDGGFPVADGVMPNGGGVLLLGQMLRARRRATAAERQGGGVPSPLPVVSPSAVGVPDPMALDRLAEREARRYDGGFTLF